MKLERLQPDPGGLLEFYEQGLGALGALCERTWHDRLEVVAEGASSALWKTDGTLHGVELHFAPADATEARDAAREVFPGCQLTFRLAEALRISPLLIERFMLPETSVARVPEASVVEKLWRAQFPETTRWQMTAPFQAAFHFSLVALARCEIQAIDQHWSLHRIAVSLPGGELDEDLARAFGFDQTSGGAKDEMVWPTPDPARWAGILKQGFEREIAVDLAGIRARQEESLRRELERIDEYFENYGAELSERVGRSSAASKL